MASTLPQTARFWIIFSDTQNIMIPSTVLDTKFYTEFCPIRTGITQSAQMQ